MISYFSWQNEFKKYDYNVQAHYAINGNEILSHISDGTFKQLDEYLKSDRKEYEKWMSAN